MQAALAAADKAVTALDTSTSQRLEAVQALNDNKFVTYRTLLDSNAEKVKIAFDADRISVEAAFAASKDAIAAAFASSKEAIQKAEIFNEKRFELMSKQIDELKSKLTLMEGKGAGASALWAYALGVVGFVATILAIVLSVARFSGG